MDSLTSKIQELEAQLQKEKEENKRYNNLCEIRISVFLPINS